MKYLILVVLLLSMFSCADYVESKQDSIGPYTDIRRQFLTQYFSDYSSLRRQAMDTLENYKEDSLGYIANIFYTDNWTIDSVFIFSSDSTRFYTKKHSNLNASKNLELDCIIDFGGALIEGKWYFFQMGTVTYVPRGDYHHDPYEPLSFEELSYIAWRGAIPGLIYRQEDGGIATNHKAIDQMFFSTDKRRCPDSSRIRECKDSVYLSNLKALTRGKLSKKEILEIQEEIATSKKPYVPPYKELTDKDRRRGKKEKLFDSKAWKERYDYKKEEEIK